MLQISWPYLGFCPNPKHFIVNCEENIVYQYLVPILSPVTDNCPSWISQNQQNECVPSKDSDQPGHPPSLIRVFAVHMKKAFWSLAPNKVHSEDSYQTGKMPRLIWVFAVRTVTLLVLSCCSSNTFKGYWHSWESNLNHYYLVTKWHANWSQPVQTTLIMIKGGNPFLYCNNARSCSTNCVCTHT